MTASKIANYKLLFLLVLEECLFSIAEVVIIGKTNGENNESTKTRKKKKGILSYYLLMENIAKITRFVYMDQVMVA
jgi:hypothetical protein